MTMLRVIDGCFYQVEQTDAPAHTVRDQIATALADYNAAFFGPDSGRPLALLLRDLDEVVIGGLYGRTQHNWLYIALLFVPEPLRGRGLGRELLARAEEEAHRRGALGVFIDTFNPSAAALYTQLGYKVFGRLENFVAGRDRVFLKKTF